MFCENCGAELQDNALFCSNCGAKAEVPSVTLRESKKGFAGKLILSLILSLFLLICVATVVVRFSICNSLSEENIAKVVDKIEISDIEVDDFIPLKEDMLMSEYMYQYLTKNGNLPFLNEHIITDIIEDDATKELAVEKINEYCEYFLGKSDDAGIKAKDLVSLIRKKSDEIYDETGYYLTDADYDYLKNRFESMGVEESDIDNIYDMNPDTIDKVRFFLSDMFLAIDIVLGVLLLVGIFFLNLRRKRAVALYAAVVCLITGVVGMVVSFLGNVIVSNLHRATGYSKKIFSGIVNIICSQFRLNSIIVLIIGTVLLFLFIILNIIVKSSKVKKANES
jgi:hypothetical protein